MTESVLSRLTRRQRLPSERRHKSGPHPDGGTTGAERGIPVIAPLGRDQHEPVELSPHYREDVAGAPLPATPSTWAQDHEASPLSSVTPDMTSSPEEASASALSDISLPARVFDFKLNEVVGLVITVAAVLLAMFHFYIYVFSGLTGARNQNQLLHHLTNDPKTIFDLASGQKANDGEPVAIIDIPAIAVHQAVVQGTTPADLQQGPGLVDSSVVPGDPGDSIIAGRRTSFGGPFGRLSSLQPGNSIKIVDGLGTFDYTVTKASLLNEGSVSIPAESRNWLTLVSSDSSWIPTSHEIIFARLDGSAAANSSPVTKTTYSLPSFGGDAASGILALAWALAFLVLLGFSVFSVKRWRQPWVSWLLAAPVLLACGLFACESMARVLPSTL